MNETFWLESLWPLTIIRDRYTGSYSLGKFTAWPLHESNIPFEQSGGDSDCIDFWSLYTGMVGKGNTPQEALDDLIMQVQKSEQDSLIKKFGH